MKKNKEFRESFWEMVEEAEDVVITGHIGPDDDSVSSVLAVYWLIRDRFPKKMIRMVCPGETSDEWEYFENFEKIKFVKEITEVLFAEKKSLLIVLDGGSFDRFSKKPEKLKGLVNKTICIDHHGDEPDNFDLLHISPSYSSTAEAIYRLLVEDDGKVPKRLAEIFLLGILGDTGNFSYLNKDNAKVLEIVQKLIFENEISIQKLQSKYIHYSKRILMLVGEMISNTKYFDGVGSCPAFQVGIFSREFLDKYSFSDEEISRASHLYMSHYLGSVKKYDWGMSITPRKNGVCGLSFRSLPGVVNVRKVAEKFNGGGHDLASGGEVKVESSEKALEIVLEQLK